MTTLEQARMFDAALKPVKATQDTRKTLGHASPSMMAHDVAEIHQLLTDIGAPVMNASTTQLGDIISRLVWCKHHTRTLEQVTK